MVEMVEMAEVVELAAADTHPLRRTVLRTGTVSDVVVFDGDDDPATFHLGVRREGEVIAVSTWMRRRYPDRPELVGYQLRGMATAPPARSRGIGTQLLAHGTARCEEGGAGLVWARARVTALGFYRHHGFDVIGHEYVDLATGLPHRDIVRLLGTEGSTARPAPASAGTPELPPVRQEVSRASAVRPPPLVGPATTRRAPGRARELDRAFPRHGAR